MQGGLIYREEKEEARITIKLKMVKTLLVWRGHLSKTLCLSICSKTQISKGIYRSKKSTLINLSGLRHNVKLHGTEILSSQLAILMSYWVSDGVLSAPFGYFSLKHTYAGFLPFPSKYKVNAVNMYFHKHTYRYIIWCKLCLMLYQVCNIYIEGDGM